MFVLHNITAYGYIYRRASYRLLDVCLKTRLLKLCPSTHEKVST